MLGRVVFIVCWAFVTTAHAENLPCGDKENLNRRFTAEELSVKGLLARERLIETTLKSMVETKVIVAIRPCFKFNRSVYTIKYPLVPQLSEWSTPEPISHYVVNLTSGFVLDASESDLLRVIRTEACRITTGNANVISERFAPLPREMKVCMLDAAVAAFDLDYARWLSRTFDRWPDINQQPALLSELTGNRVLMHVPEIDGKTLERLERLHDPPHW